MQVRLPFDGKCKLSQCWLKILEETFLGLLQEQLSVEVIRSETVVSTPLTVLVSMLTAEGELAPSNLTVLLELHQLVKCEIDIVHLNKNIELIKWVNVITQLRNGYIL